jgi:hypothetical protein
MATRSHVFTCHMSTSGVDARNTTYVRVVLRPQMLWGCDGDTHTHTHTHTTHTHTHTHNTHTHTHIGDVMATPKRMMLTPNDFYIRCVVWQRHHLGIVCTHRAKNNVELNYAHREGGEMEKRMGTCNRARTTNDEEKVD